MKYTLLAALIIVLAGLFMVPFIYRNLRGGIASYLHSAFTIATSTNSGTPKVGQTSTKQPQTTGTSTKSSSPSQFRGPTGQPHIIGPSAPPPNY